MKGRKLKKMIEKKDNLLYNDFFSIFNQFSSNFFRIYLYEINTK